MADLDLLSDAYFPGAVVTARGVLQELNGGAGKRILESNPDLLTCILELLSDGVTQSDFYWNSHDQGWISVSMTCSDDAAGVRRATVELNLDPPPFGITLRELDVLTLVADGLSNPEIAAHLHTSVRTIATHIEHLLSKTNRPNRAALAVTAIELGLVRRPAPGRPVPRAPGSLAGHAVDHSRRGRGAGKRPFIIGSAFPLQGPAGADGHEMKNGSALAIAELNARGGIAGRPIRQIVLDLDIFSPESAEETFRELVKAEVDALTSGYLFVEDAARNIITRYGAPYLHAMTSEHQAQLVREQLPGASHIFQVCPTEAQYGVKFIDFLDELVERQAWHPPNRLLAVIETPLPSGEMLNRGTFDRAEASRWSIERCDLVPPIGADWQTVVDGVRRLRPAAIMITHFLPSELARFQRAFVAAATPSLIYAVYTPSVPQFLETAGAAAEGLVWSTASGTYHDSLGREFSGRYMRAYSCLPGGSHAGIAYDEVYLLAHAWATVENPRDFSAVASALRGTIYRGVNGAYSLGGDDQTALPYPDVTPDPSLGQAHLVLQVQSGVHRILSPVPYAEAKFQLPPWLLSN